MTAGRASSPVAGVVDPGANPNASGLNLATPGRAGFLSPVDHHLSSERSPDSSGLGRSSPLAPRDAHASGARVAWMLGWAIPQTWLEPIAHAAFPAAEHTFIAASPTALDSLEKSPAFDRLIGYSLGALLLLQQPQRVARHRRVDLLAPFFAFACEEELGGRIARAQVRYLIRWLQRDPAAALADFYTRAGLSGTGVPPAHSALSASLPDLVWGLERLASDRVNPPLPPGWRGWCGDRDALLDAGLLNRIDASISVVCGATHHPAALLAALLRDDRRIDAQAQEGVGR